jgi:NADH:ubiquinone oxidoreductase subunit K
LVYFLKVFVRAFASDERLVGVAFLLSIYRLSRC